MCKVRHFTYLLQGHNTIHNYITGYILFTLYSVLLKPYTPSIFRLNLCPKLRNDPKMTQVWTRLVVNPWVLNNLLHCKHLSPPALVFLSSIHKLSYPKIICKVMATFEYFIHLRSQTVFLLLGHSDTGIMHEILR